MTGKVQLITFGGTLLMKKNQDGGLSPFYGIGDVLLLDHLQHAGPEGETLRQALLATGKDAYAAIGRFLAKNAQLGEKEALAATKRVEKELIEKAGFDAHIRTLPYDPIDSINFDIGSHYEALRQAVLDTLAQGNVPVIAGGTDTLRMYGTLLAEDLKHLEAEGILREKSSAFILSSMFALEKDPVHVAKLMKAVRPAVDQVAHGGCPSVYAILPENEQVSHISLMDMARASDKVTGDHAKAFVGHEQFHLPVNEGVQGYSYSALPVKAGAALHGAVPAFARRRVAPPLEASNGCAAVTQFLNAVLFEEKPRFDSLIIKGAMCDDPRGDVEALGQAIALLRGKGVDVFFVNDPLADKNGALADDKKFATAPLRKQLEASGGIFVDGCTATQLFVRAGMQHHGKPVFYEQQRAQASSSHADYTGAVKQPRKPVDALALEYVPDTQAYRDALDLASKAGLRKIVSVNLTDGSMSADHVQTLKDHPEMDITATFKYAGRHQFGQTEAATLKVYTPAVELSATGLLRAGGKKTPTELLNQALGRSLS